MFLSADHMKFLQALCTNQAHGVYRRFSRGQEVMHYIYVPIVYIFLGVVHRAHHAAWKPFLSSVSSTVSVKALKQVSRFSAKYLYPGSLNTVFIPLQI